jgi:hypothetical protein
MVSGPQVPEYGQLTGPVQGEPAIGCAGGHSGLPTAASGLVPPGKQMTPNWHVPSMQQGAIGAGPGGQSQVAGAAASEKAGVFAMSALNCSTELPLMTPVGPQKHGRIAAQKFPGFTATQSVSSWHVWL